MHQKKKFSLKCLVAAWVVWLGATTVYAADPVPLAYKIEPQPVSTALKAFAAQSNLQLIFTESDVGSAKTNGVSGTKAPREALSEILKGTGLKFEFTANNVVVVRKLGRETKSDPPGGGDQNGKEKEGKTDSSQDFRLAQVDQGKTSSDISIEKQTSTGLNEIIVTAQKRAERIQDVPIPVTVINAATLVENNQFRLQDYYSEIPGLTLTTGALNQQYLSIRGISSQIGGSGTAPTVGIMVDDAPFGGSALGGGNIMPDVDPGDLASVEVLRGPQGTLYGVASMGGLVKYITIDPSTEALTGRVQTGISSFFKGDAPGYDFRASANIPLTNDLAIRVSGFTREDPGYIDDVETGQKGVNKLTATGARLAALWRPSEAWSLKFSALYQDSTTQGQNSDVDLLPGVGDWQQNRARGGEYNDTQIQNYTATLAGKLGSVDLKSISAYSSVRDVHTVDYSSVFGAITESMFGVGGAILPGLYTTDHVSQEVRFSGSLWDRLDWIVGGFFTHEYTGTTDSIVPENPVTGVQVPGGGDNLLHENAPDKYTEYAGFVDVTYHFTDRLDIQVGGRESHSTTGTSYSASGIIYSAVNPEGDATSNAFTYLLTPQFKLSSNLMLYARLASGFRPGGYQFNPSAGVPTTYAPDKTFNYEIGTKGEFLDKRLSIDASLYYIDWKNIQLSEYQIIDGVYNGYIANAGGAKSEGVEFTAEVRPLTGLTVAAWVVYDKEVLTQGFPDSSVTVGTAGDRIPFSSRYSGNLSLTQDFPISGRVTGFAGGAVAYLGNRLGKFQDAGTPREYYAPYAKVDFRAGVKYGPWTVNAYANNLTDRRALITGGADFFPPSDAAIYIQPRLVGFNLSRTF